MATGIGNLPYIMPAVSPFDTITAQETNERIANIEAVADGSGIGDGAITTAKIGNAQVTASKIDLASLMTDPKFVQTGTATINVIASGTGGGSISVTFPTAFVTTPRVFCQLLNTGADMMSMHTASVTTTGFSALARKSGTTLNSQNFHWIALNPAVLPIIGV